MESFRRYAVWVSGKTPFLSLINDGVGARRAYHLLFELTRRVGTIDLQQGNEPGDAYRLGVLVRFELFVGRIVVKND